MKILPIIRFIAILIISMHPLQSMDDQCNHLDQRRSQVNNCVHCAALVSKNNPEQQTQPPLPTPTLEKSIQEFQSLLQETIKKEKNPDSLQCLRNLLADLDK